MTRLVMATFTKESCINYKESSNEKTASTASLSPTTPAVASAPFAVFEVFLGNAAWRWRRCRK